MAPIELLKILCFFIEMTFAAAVVVAVLFLNSVQ